MPSSCILLFSFLRHGLPLMAMGMMGMMDSLLLQSVLLLRKAARQQALQTAQTVFASSLLPLR